MDGLKKVVLIKSAKYDYCEIKLDGNILLTGSNGSGKTTLLRAILFFYTGNGQAVGLNSGSKRGFTDYYLEYENSYIIYCYKNNQKYILVIVYKKDTAIRFRFAMFSNKPDIKNIFIQDNTPIDEWRLWQNLKNIAMLSNAISSGSEYKRVLYSKTGHKNRIFTLFDAKDYNAFSKTLSNIFINSKIQADSVKKVLVASLQDTDHNSIDLEQIKRFLQDFKNRHNDIKNFEKHKKNIVKIINFLNDFDKTKISLQNQISSICYSKEKAIESKNNIINNIKTNQNQLKELEAKLEKERLLFDKRKENLIEKRANIKQSLQKTNELKIKYDKIDILTKIKKYKKIDILKDELANIEKNKEFLIKEHKEIETAHKNRLDEIKNSAINTINNYKKDLLEKEKIYNKSIYNIEKQEQEEIDIIKDNYNHQKIELNSKMGELKQDKIKLENSIKNKTDKKFIFKYEDKIVLLKGQLDSLKNENLVLQEQINSYIKQIDLLEENSKKEIEDKKTNWKDIYNNLIKKKQKLEQILKPKENSLSYEILNNAQDSDKYFYFLKEDILNTQFDVDFMPNNNLLFEINFSNLNIPKNQIKSKIDEISKKIEKEKTAYSEFIKELEKLARLKLNKIYKAKNETNNKKDANFNQINIIEQKLRELNIQKEQHYKEFKQKIEKDISSLNQQLKTTNQEIKKIDISINNIDKDKFNKIKTIKTHYTKQKNNLKKEFDNIKKDIEQQIKTINDKKDKDIKLQKDSFNKLLNKKGVDIQKIEKLNKEIVLLEKTIKEYLSFGELVISYNNDKKEYIDKESIFKKELKTIQDKLKALENGYNKIKEEYNKNINNLQSIINELENKKVKILLDLEQINNFEQNMLPILIDTLSLEYIPNDILDNIQNLLSSATNLFAIYNDLKYNISNIIKRIRGDIFNNSLFIKDDFDDIKSAVILKEYYNDRKVEEAKELLSKNLNNIISSIIKEYDNLLQFQGKVKPFINKITKLFDEVKINVIDKLTMRYQPSNNKIIETLDIIKKENDDSFGYELNLFTIDKGKKDAKNIIELLDKLYSIIQDSHKNSIDFDDSFVLEFRVIENGNDSGFVTSLNNIGSEGTDILVKTMIYVAMLYLLGRNNKNNIKLDVILDEVGKLSQNYLKELISFANTKGIYFINAAPDEKLTETYKRTYKIKNKNKISFAYEMVWR